ncbi:MAG: putative Integrase [Bacteroidetes bacterium]|nr:putative Integrase [Bacteroidota bacterium]
MLDENPFKQVKLCHFDDELPLYLTVEEFCSLLSEMDAEWLRDTVVVAVLTGMRRGELLNLQWDTVDFNSRVIGIQSHGNFRIKQGKRRAVPMNVQVVKVLERRFSERIGDLVFHVNGAPIGERRLTKYFKRCVRRAKVNDALHFHSLRHSFASWLVQGNVSLYQVQKLLGHSNIRVTEVYSHLLPESMHNTVDKLQIAL